MNPLLLPWRRPRTEPARRRSTRSARPDLQALETRQLLSLGDVTQYRYDFSQNGVNPYETTLTPENVNPTTFGKLFEVPVDGQVLAEPLHLSDVNITVGDRAGVHDVVFVATMHDSVYAVDAQSGDVLWQVGFLNPAAGVTTIAPTDVGEPSVGKEIGITSTPALDPSTGTLYVLARTKEMVSGVTHFVQTLHALDISSGAEKLGGPVVVADTSIENGAFVYNTGPFVYGTGDGTIGGKIYFNSLRQNQRSALTLVNDRLFIGSGAQGVVGPYHGWVLSYDARTLQLNGALCTTPNGGRGGIWQSGAGASVDAQGNLYYVTGNGTFDTQLDRRGFPSRGNFGCSVIKVALDASTSAANQGKNGWGLKIVDYFTPSNVIALAKGDVDLGSSGAVLLPDNNSGRGPVRQVLVAGKEGKIFLLNRDSLGKFNARRDRAVQSLPGALTEALGTAAVFNNRYYYASLKDYARSFSLSRGRSSAGPVSISQNRFGYPGATPSISSNGAANAVLWMEDVWTGQLRAYDPANLGRVLYDSSQAPNGRDRLKTLTKFSVPTISHGRVYLGTNNSLAVFGLLASPSTLLTPPSLARAVAVSDRSVTLAWQDNATDEDGYQVFRRTGSGGFGLLTTLPAGTTNFVDTGLASGTQYAYYVAPFSSAGASSSNTVDVTTAAPLRALPQKWRSVDTGAATIPGYAGTLSSKVFSVTGSSAGSSDGVYQYVYQTLQGNFRLTARVSGLQSPVNGAKAGVLVRSSLDADSPSAFTFVSQGYGAGLQARPDQGGASTTRTGPAVAAPYWVRLVRSGNTFTSLVSSNGRTWRRIGSSTIAMPSVVHAGLAVTSGSQSWMSTATFNGVQVQPLRRR